MGVPCMPTGARVNQQHSNWRSERSNDQGFGPQWQQLGIDPLGALTQVVFYKHNPIAHFICVRLLGGVIIILSSSMGLEENLGDGGLNTSKFQTNCRGSRIWCCRNSFPGDYPALTFIVVLKANWNQ